MGRRPGTTGIGRGIDHKGRDDWHRIYFYLRYKWAGRNKPLVPLSTFGFSWASFERGHLLRHFLGRRNPCRVIILDEHKTQVVLRLAVPPKAPKQRESSTVGEAAHHCARCESQNNANRNERCGGGRSSISRSL